MHTLTSAGVILASAVFLSGCASEAADSTPPTESTESVPATPSADASVEAEATAGESIPDGTYAKKVTHADAIAAGVTDKGFLAQLRGAAMTFTYKLSGDRWTLFQQPDGGVPEPGDGGALRYDGDGDAVMVSESEGCPGCAYSYRWMLTGDTLSLRLVGHDSTDGPQDLAAVRFVTEGRFTREP